MKQVELAKKWGVAKSRITQYKSEGMPVDSEQSALAWLSMNYPDRAVEVVGKSTQSIDQVAELPVMPTDKDVKSKDLSVVVARMAKNENYHWDHLNRAIEQDNTLVPSYAKNYYAASEARLAAEKEYAEYLVKTGELIQLTEAIELIGSILSPVKTMLSALPFSCASRANPTDPDLARAAIMSECDRMINNIRNELDKLKA